MQDLFAQAGYRAGGKSASRIISGVVHKFFVVEGGLYKAALDLSLTVSDSKGKVLSSETVEGTSSTFGRTYHLADYEQVLSNSVVSAADKLMRSTTLSKALSIPRK